MPGSVPPCLAGTGRDRPPHPAPTASGASAGPSLVAPFALSIASSLRRTSPVALFRCRQSSPPPPPPPPPPPFLAVSEPQLPLSRSSPLPVGETRGRPVPPEAPSPALVFFIGDAVQNLLVQVRPVIAVGISPRQGKL
ncbi:hypothetical protein NL676_018954 [Syzygium grande]|nr:hypothetical protein NL676_018954 [Syzygium grande]